MSKKQKMRKWIIIAAVFLLIIIDTLSTPFFTDELREFQNRLSSAPAYFTILYTALIMANLIYVNYRKPEERYFTPSAIYKGLILRFAAVAAYPVFTLVLYYYSGLTRYLFVLAFDFVLIMSFLSLTGFFDRIGLIKSDPNAFLIIRNVAYISYAFRKGTAQRDMPAEWLLEPVNINSIDGFNMMLSLRNNYYENKDWKNALRLSIKLLTDAPVSISKNMTLTLKCDTLTIMIMGSEPTERIRACYENIKRFLHNSSGNNAALAAKATAIFAYYTFIEKNEAKTMIAKQDFYKYYEKQKKKQQLVIEKEIIETAELTSSLI
jgi:hypothetical protein